MKIRISRKQLFALILLFQIGSTTLFALGIKAKQDAWIAILVAMLIGFILLWIYTELQRHYPEKNFAEIIIALLGKPLGVPLVFFYALYFIYISTHNLNEFGNLATMTFLEDTPLIVVLSLFIIIVLYILFSGLEVLARTGEIMSMVVLLFLIGSYILIGISGNIDLDNLKPIIGNGIVPIFKAAYPQVVNFPFGEMIVFFMYWCYLDSKKAVRRISFFALGVSGILLAITTMIIIAVLGVNDAEGATIPLLDVIKRIKLFGFITNLDAIAIVTMTIGGFYKMTIFFYGGALALSTLLESKDDRLIIFVAAIFTLWISIVGIPTFLFQRWLGLKVNIPYIHVPFQIIIPTLLLVISWLKAEDKFGDKR